MLPAFVLALGAALLGWVVATMGVTIEGAKDWQSAFWWRLQVLFVFSVLIERSTEVYLNMRDLNGPDRFQQLSPVAWQARAARKPANLSALVLSVVVAVAGVRLMDTLGTLKFAESVGDVSKCIAQALWSGVDVIISAGLMAGGATLFHELAEALRGGLGRMGNRMSLTEGEREVMRVQRMSGLASYRIEIRRTSASEGSLIFVHGETRVEARVLCDPQNTVPRGLYNDCSRTTMPLKIDALGTLSSVMAIHMPSARVPGIAEPIAIRVGSDSATAYGCFLINQASFDALCQTIKGVDGRNVAVNVVDL